MNPISELKKACALAQALGKPQKAEIIVQPGENPFAVLSRLTSLNDPPHEVGVEMTPEDFCGVGPNGE